MSVSLWVHAGPCLRVPADADVVTIAGADVFHVAGREAGWPFVYLYANSANAPGRYYERTSDMPEPLDVHDALTADECEEFSGFYAKETRLLTAALGAANVLLAWRIIAEWS